MAEKRYLRDYLAENYGVILGQHQNIGDFENLTALQVMLLYHRVPDIMHVRLGLFSHIFNTFTPEELELTSVSQNGDIYQIALDVEGIFDLLLSRYGMRYLSSIGLFKMLTSELHSGLDGKYKHVIPMQQSTIERLVQPGLSYSGVNSKLLSQIIYHMREWVKIMSRKGEAYDSVRVRYDLAPLITLIKRKIGKLQTLAKKKHLLNWQQASNASRVAPVEPSGGGGGGAASGAFAMPPDYDFLPRISGKIPRSIYHKDDPKTGRLRGRAARTVRKNKGEDPIPLVPGPLRYPYPPEEPEECSGGGCTVMGGRRRRRNRRTRRRRLRKIADQMN